MPTRSHIAAVAPDLDRPTRAKIIATLGPASESPETIRRLIEAGVSIFRLNFSHGDLDAHQKRLQSVRDAASAMNRPIAVLGDLGGPKIRIGRVPEPMELAAGQDVLLSRSATEASLVSDRAGADASAAVLPLTYPGLVDEVDPGHRILINDGAIRMLAVERTPDALRARVTFGGTVTSGKGINLPDTDLSIPAITPRDWECVEWAVRNSIDFLALSFVRRAAEVRELKDRLGGMCPVLDELGTPTDPRIAMGSTIPIIAKIEKPQAVEALDEIVEAADAIMVARGDLGVEMDLSQVPIVQKKVIDCCEAWGKPCIVATQMLESMILHASPTRAEIGDIANAVFEGADAVMLSGETAAGRYPVLAVETMRRAIAAAEAHLGELPATPSPPAKLVQSRYATAALAHGAWHIAGDIGATIIVCWSESGGTARYLSQNDFRIPIVAYTSSALAARRMTLLRGVVPIHRPPPPSGSLGDFTTILERDLLDRGWVHKGEPVVILAGKPLGEVRATNSIALLYIGDPRGGYRAHKS